MVNSFQLREIGAGLIVNKRCKVIGPPIAGVESKAAAYRGIKPTPESPRHGTLSILVLIFGFMAASLRYKDSPIVQSGITANPIEKVL